MRREAKLLARVRWPLGFEFVFRVVIVLLVGMYYDHQQMPPGAIVVAAIGLLVGQGVIERRRPELEAKYPEAEAVAQLLPIVRTHGSVVIEEITAAVRRRTLPQRTMREPEKRRRDGDGE